MAWISCAARYILIASARWRYRFMFFKRDMLTVAHHLWILSTAADL